MKYRAHVRTSTQYSWNNSSQPIVTRLHTAFDSLQVTRGSISTVPGKPDAPTISYSGFPQGLMNILKLTDTLRGNDFPGEVTWKPLAKAQPPADIEFIGNAKQMSRPEPATMTMPFRFHLTIPTPSLESVASGISKRERSRFRAITGQLAWRTEIVQDIGQVDAFYRNMHLPTMAVRHSEATRTESLAMTRQIASKGGLFLIRDPDRAIAGCVFTDHHGVFTTRLLGVQGGMAEHYDSGAFKALYLHMLRHCAASPHIGTMDLFGTESFMSKGIFQWKRKLGAGPVRAPNHFARKMLHLRVHADNPGVRRFLASNPVLATRNGQFVPVYFYDSENPARVSISSKADGVEQPIRISLDEFLHGLPNNIANVTGRRRNA